jgi:predicted Zn-dependent peptidase
MKPHLVFAGILCALTAAAQAAPPTVHRRTLPNGIRVCYLHQKDSPDVSIFTFLPMGLAFDDAGRTQWAHLIEHLVVRSTVPGQLKTANAETQPDHMRLDFYDTRENWRDGLNHHARWIKGEPFTDVSVREEPARANREADFVVKAFATHKFATAAWNQAVRHGRDAIAVKGDLLNVDRATLQAYRDAHLVTPDRTLVCVIGGEAPDVVFDAVTESLGAVKSAAKPAESREIKAGTYKAKWDLNARHVLLTWPIPGPGEDPADHAALMVLSRLTWMHLAQDAQLGMEFGPLIPGTDLRCPESSYFFISATARDVSKPAAQSLSTRARRVFGSIDQTPPMLVTEFAAQLTAEMDVQDPVALRAQAPAHFKPGMIEAQIALTWGTAEYRLGSERAKIANAIKGVTVAQVRRAAEKYLKADRCTSLELIPAQ